MTSYGVDKLLNSSYEREKYLELADFSYVIPEPDYETLHDALITSVKNDKDKEGFYRQPSPPRYNLCNYILLISSSIIDAYVCDFNVNNENPYIIIVIKTKDNCLSSDYWNLFYAFKYNFINLEKYFSGKLLINNSFYEDVKEKISLLKSQYSSYSFYGVGQGEGGAILDDLINNGMLYKSISLNPLIESKNFKDRLYNKLYNSKLYYSTDSPFWKTFGKLCDLVNLLDYKPSIGKIDPRLVYTNLKPTIISNATDNPSFYRGPGLSTWSSISITFTGKYQIASNLYGELYYSKNFGQTWTRKISKYNYSNDYSKLNCSEVKMGWSSGKALFLRQEELYISNDYGNTWSRVSEVVINKNSVENVKIHISLDMLRMMVCIPYKSLYISEDGGKTWFDFTKRRDFPGYLNYLQEQEKALKPSHNEDFVFTNVNDIDLPLPYTNDWDGLKFIRIYEIYIWKPQKTPPTGAWTFYTDDYLTDYNPILTFTDYRIKHIQKKHEYDSLYLDVGKYGRVKQNGISFNIYPNPSFNRHILIPTSTSLYLSTDNGFTFTKCFVPERNYNHNWTCTAMSMNGEFQIAAYNDDIENNTNGSLPDAKSALMKSNDYGKTWAYWQDPPGGLINSRRYNWTSLSIADNGGFITAVCNRIYSETGLKRDDNIDEGLIVTSCDGGLTWNEKR